MCFFSNDLNTLNECFVYYKTLDLKASYTSIRKLLQLIFTIMESLLVNLKTQSIKSLLICIVSTVLALYILQNISDLILGGGFWFNKDWLISSVVTNLFVCLGMAMLVYQKGLRAGLLIGLAVFIIVIPPFVFLMGLNGQSISYFIIGIVNYLLPGAILGMCRKD